MITTGTAATSSSRTANAHPGPMFGTDIIYLRKKNLTVQPRAVGLQKEAQQYRVSELLDRRMVISK